MAGFRTFATGEVLTAANVNDFLMKQSVMVFDDATARTAALGAEVAEGMLTFNKDTGALEVFDGSDFVPAGAEPPAGIGSNVVQTVRTEPFGMSTSSTAFTIVPGMGATITPSTSTSMVLIIAQVTIGFNGGNAGTWKVTRAGTDIYRATTGVGANQALAVFSGGPDSQGPQRRILSNSIVFLDSPGTVSPTTYRLEVTNGTSNAGLALLNRTNGDFNNTSDARGASSITVIEVAA